MKMENITNVRDKHMIKISLTLFIMLITFFSSLSAQPCPLGCNNLVQISLGDGCSTTITPEMILEGEDEEGGCDYSVEILGPNDVPLNPPDVVNENHIGMTLKVSVILEGSNNSCWGYITIEDKQPPEFIECPDTVSILCYSNMEFPIPEAEDNCDDLVDVWIVSDIITDIDCEENDTLSAIREIVYQAKDSQGNLSEFCTRVILYLRVDLDDVMFPENLDNNPTPALEACGNWDLDGDNFPDPWVDLNNNGILDPGESESGVPFIEDEEDGDFPIFPNNSYCEINATFHDKIIEVCENSNKYIRHWTLLDWCTAEIRDSNQIIKVIDTTDPVAMIPGPGDITEFAHPYSCGADVRIPPPIKVEDCTTVNYTVQYLLADKFGKEPLNGQFISKNVMKIDQKEVGPDGTEYDYYYIIKDLPVGITWLRYILTDDCGNQTILQTEVIVIDHVPPIPVCDEFTVVTLTATGFAKVYAETFDDGSHDNCSDKLKFEVRRLNENMEPDTTCVYENKLFRDFVEFCCEDVGDDYMVELRVWDDGNGSGIYGDTIPIVKRLANSDFLDTIGYLTDNYNSCMIVVEVQDKVDPWIVCPPNITVECGEDLWDLSIFGTVRGSKDSVEEIEIIEGLFVDWDGPLKDGYAVDNCEFMIEEQVTRNIDKCQTGYIDRKFIATDKSGRMSMCTQRITVQKTSTFHGSINWPEDITLDNCEEGAGIEPEDLEEYDFGNVNYGFPLYGDDLCSQLAVTYEDQRFNFVDGVCFKILRKWVVIDWCEYESSNRRAGVWDDTQVIKVNDSDAPIIQNTSDMTFCTYGPGCGGYIELVNGADDCTPEEFLKWSYEIDLFMNDTIDHNGNSSDASDWYPVGIHQITWFVEDMCGNNAKVTYKFEIQDCKNPTPYCISDITTVVMPTSGEITIWANDFDRGSFDNCEGKLRFSFTEPNLSLTDLGLDTSMTFVCPEDEGMHDLDMYVIDEANNYDYCTVTINIQVNHDCGEGESAAVSVSGYIESADDEAVESVNVSLQNMSSNQMLYYQTDASGQYAFKEIPDHTDFMVAAEKNNDILNGVNTLDIVLIQRHILGIKELDDPYKLIAADVNNNKSVAGSDIIQLRKVILGIYNEFPNNKSWKFVNASQVYFDNTAPWEYEEYIKIEDLSGDMNGNNFVGVKVGDVDHGSKANVRDGSIGTRSDIQTVLTVENKGFMAGDLVEVSFTTEELQEFWGYQMTLEYDTENLTFIDFTDGSIDLSDNNLGLTQPGFISMSWNDIQAIGLNGNEPLFTLTFRAKTNSTIRQSLELNSEITASEAYVDGFQVTELSLEYKDAEFGEVILEQNRPNPFSDRTIISFTLEEDAPATLSIFDITGRLIHRVTGSYYAGKNNIEINGNEFTAAGVLYYQLEAGNFKSTKKMIKINR